MELLLLKCDFCALVSFIQICRSCDLAPVYLPPSLRKAASSACLFGVCVDPMSTN